MTATTSLARRDIPHLVDQRQIAAFFSTAEPYDDLVTHEDFDVDDNWGPGHYYGVRVPADESFVWDRGLQLCKERGLHPRSADGMLLRWQQVDPEATELPPGLAQVVEEHERAVRRAEEEAEAKARRKAELDELRAGIRVDLSQIPLSSTHRERVMDLAESRGVPLYRLRPDDSSRSIGTNDLELITKDTGGTGGMCFYRLVTGDVLTDVDGYKVLYCRDGAVARQMLQAACDACREIGGDYWSHYGDQFAEQLSAL